MNRCRNNFWWIIHRVTVNVSNRKWSYRSSTSKPKTTDETTDQNLFFLSSSKSSHPLSSIKLN